MEHLIIEYIKILDPNPSHFAVLITGLINLALSLWTLHWLILFIKYSWKRKI